MKGDENISEAIEAYLAHRLSKEERELMEASISRDPFLQQAFDRETFLSRLVLENELLEVKKQMRSDLEKKDKRRLIRNKWLAGCVTLALVSIAGLVYLTSTHLKDSSTPLQKDSSLSTSLHPEQPLRKNPSPLSRVSSPPVETAPNTPLVDLAPQNRSEKEKMNTVQSLSPSIETPKEVSRENLVAPQEKIVHQTKESSSPCQGKSMEATLQSTSTFKGESTGKIRISLTSPSQNGSLAFSLHPSNGFEPVRQWEHLSAGTYHIYSKDDQGCVLLLGETTVKETWCVQDYPKTYAPDHDPAWKVPVLSDVEVSIKITDKTGTLLFDSQGWTTQEMTWAGNLTTGAPVPSGVYKVFISYKSGETCVASVTVFR